MVFSELLTNNYNVITGIIRTNYVALKYLLGRNYNLITGIIRINYLALNYILGYNYKHIKRIFTHIYMYNTSDSYVKSVQKKIDSAGLHGSKSPKDGKRSERKGRKDS